MPDVIYRSREPPQPPLPRCGPAASVFIVSVVLTAIFVIPINVVKATCLDDGDLTRVSWIYGPGFWGAWLVISITVLATTECDSSQKAVWTTPSSKSTSSRDNIDVENEAGKISNRSDPYEEPRQPPGVDLELLVSTGYPVLATLDFIYQISKGKATAEYEAARAVSCASAAIAATTHCLSYHRTTWSRRFLWFLLTYSCFIVAYAHVFIPAAGSISLILFDIIRFFSFFIQMLLVPFILDPQRRREIPLDCVGGLVVMAYAGFSLVGIPLLLLSIPAFEEAADKGTFCETDVLTSVVPRTDKSLLDPLQAAALCFGLLNSAKCLRLWHRDRQNRRALPVKD